jgi:hypothetical protein
MGTTADGQWAPMAGGAVPRSWRRQSLAPAGLWPPAPGRAGRSTRAPQRRSPVGYREGMSIASLHPALDGPFGRAQHLSHTLWCDATPGASDLMGVRSAQCPDEACGGQTVHGVASKVRSGSDTAGLEALSGQRPSPRLARSLTSDGGAKTKPSHRAHHLHHTVLHLSGSPVLMRGDVIAPPEQARTVSGVRPARSRTGGAKLVYQRKRCLAERGEGLVRWRRFDGC